MPQITAALLRDGSASIKVRALVDPAVDGVQISLSLLESGGLTAVREEVVTEDLHNNGYARSRLMRDNPLFDPSAIELLDEQGLIRPGSVVRSAAVLASVLQFIDRPSGNNPPAPGMVRIKDGSLTVPEKWDGATVKDAEYLTRQQLGRDAPANLVGRILIRLQLTLPISIGDVLIINGSLCAIAGFCKTSVADLVVSQVIGDQFGWAEGQTVEVSLGVVEQAARWAIQARATGYYSLITQQPLRGHDNRPGQKILPEHIHTLRSAGLIANLSELVTVKSDDVGGRAHLHMALDGRGHFPKPGLPESFHVLVSELNALGFATYLSDAGNHLALSLGLMTDPDRMSISFGNVTKPETINYRTYRAEPQGLFCERIFGPERDWECSCGKYAGTQFKGTICDKCGVKVTHSRVRRLRFGHIVLPDPIIPWYFRVPAPDAGPSVLAKILNLGDWQIAGLLGEKMSVDDNGNIAQSADAADLTGVAAIERLLTKVPDDALPQSLRDRTDPRSAFVVRTLLVLPPDLRPLVLLQNGNFATSDLNDLYRRVINRANRLRKLKELRAPLTIIRNEIRCLQNAADQLFANTSLPPGEQSDGGSCRPLKDLLEMALFRATLRDGKRVDYSGRARIVSHASMELEQVVLPKCIAEILQITPGAPVLITRAPAPGEFAVPIVPLAVAIHEHPVVCVNPEIFSALYPAAPNSELVPECLVLRPLTPAAVKEAANRSGRVLRAPEARSQSWQDAGEVPLVRHTIIDAAVAGRPLHFDSPAGVLLAGVGATALSPAPASDPGDAVLRMPRTMDIPIPPEPPTVQGPDLIVRMRDLAMDHRRKALVFNWRKLGRPARIEDGTIGLGPWLPPGFQWPEVQGKRLDFIAQLPIDPPRAAGVLPPGALDHVAPGTLLTLFWNCQAWEPATASQQLLKFIPITRELVRENIVERRRRHLPKFSEITLVPELVDEVPSVAELREMFDFEFGTVDPKLLTEFEKTIGLTLPTPQQLPKFGGWPAWIQSPDSSCPLLLQVPSDEASGLNFGDSGTVYATFDRGTVSLLMQCY